eukprot:TRINITY_DN8649_c0_g1_i1.p1 TRINITY_DN8649_c0_g1~~TRINITY_DN8649_c0_g1_i1.p1  ORF type:complete len:499 (+),score=74.67 TRINITY_DN8649_c0_g1_i1:100-1596(+)
MAYQAEYAAGFHSLPTIAAQPSLQFSFQDFATEPDRMRLSDGSPTFELSECALPGSTELALQLGFEEFSSVAHPSEPAAGPYSTPPSVSHPRRENRLPTPAPAIAKPRSLDLSALKVQLHPSQSEPALPSFPEMHRQFAGQMSNSGQKIQKRKSDSWLHEDGVPSSKASKSFEVDPHMLELLETLEEGDGPSTSEFGAMAGPDDQHDQAAALPSFSSLHPTATSSTVSSVSSALVLPAPTMANVTPPSVFELPNNLQVTRSFTARIELPASAPGDLEVVGFSSNGEQSHAMPLPSLNLVLASAGQPGFVFSLQAAVIYQQYDDPQDHDSLDAPAEDAETIDQAHSNEQDAKSWVLSLEPHWQERSVPLLRHRAKDVGVFRLTANTMASVSIKPKSAAPISKPRRREVKRGTESSDEDRGHDGLVIEAQLTLTGKLSNRTSAKGYGVCIFTSYASSRSLLLQSGQAMREIETKVARTPLINIHGKNWGCRRSADKRRRR